jgi:hypothetical protein
MKGFTRLAVVAVAAGLLGMTACARPTPDDAPAVGEMSELSWDAQALQSLGVSPAELPAANAVAAAPTPSTTDGAKADKEKRRHPRFKRLRFGFGRNVLHGEAVVQTEEGQKTVVVQRGAVTAITSTSVTVRSTDGFTLTWTFSDKLRVFERRNQIQPSAVAVGTQVGIAGARESSGPVARLIVIPRPR